MENLTEVESRDGQWHVGVDELKALKAGVVVGGHANSEPKVSEGCHRCPNHKLECTTFPYLVHRPSVF